MGIESPWGDFLIKMKLFHYAVLFAAAIAEESADYEDEKAVGAKEEPKKGGGPNWHGTPSVTATFHKPKNSVASVKIGGQEEWDKAMSDGKVHAIGIFKTDYWNEKAEELGAGFYIYRPDFYDLEEYGDQKILKYEPHDKMAEGQSLPSRCRLGPR